MWRLSAGGWSRGFCSEGRWCDAEAAQAMWGLHETDVATDVQDNLTERGEKSVGAERPQSWVGFR